MSRKAANGSDKQAKSVIVHYRITKAQADMLNARLKKHPVVGLRSHNQLCRKFMIDMLNGRAEYRKKEDALVDSDLYPA